MMVLVVAEAVAIALLGLLVAGLLRSHAEILRRLHQLGAGEDQRTGPIGVEFGLQPGVAAPRGTPTGAAPATGHDIAGQTPSGDAVAITVVGSPGHTLVAFLSSGCSTCAGFWAAFARPELALPFNTRLVIVTRSGGQESESAIDKLAPPTVPVVMSSPTWDAYEVPVAPYFVLVEGRSGAVLGEGAATAWAQVANLMEQALADSKLAQAPRADRTPVSVDRDTGDDAFRAGRADAELLAAGIGPGHASLFPATLPAPPDRD
jgi:hypothetical protein